VERCSDCCSLARAGNATLRVVVGEDRGQIAIPKATSVCGGPQCLVDLLGAVQLARSTASQTLRLTRVAPAAAAAISHASAPGPIARNASSSALPARGLRSIAPPGLGG